MSKNRYRFVFLRSLLVIFLAVWFLGLSLGEERSDIEYRGAVLSHVHIAGSGYGSERSTLMHSHLKGVGYDTVQLNTYVYIRSNKDTNLDYSSDPTMSYDNIEAEIMNLKKNGFKVMLKPHIWVSWWQSDPDYWKDTTEFKDPRKSLDLKDDRDIMNWLDPRDSIDIKDPTERAKWFSSYTDFIVSHAELAERSGVDILVIGTELKRMTRYTDEWEEVIRKVRESYSGKLTYSAQNYNAFNIEFWDKLDYIGLDAYFTVSTQEPTTIRMLLSGWRKYEARIRNLSRKYDKRVIFTEIGYKSVEGSAIRPWEWSSDGRVSQEEQALAFKAIFTTFLNKPYLAGVFIWKYFTDNDSYERINIQKGFTPYGKKAEKVISGWFESLNDG